MRNCFDPSFEGFSFEIANCNVLDSSVDEKIIKRGYHPLHIVPLSLFHSVQRRLGDAQIAIFYDPRKLTVEKGEEQGANV